MSAELPVAITMACPSCGAGIGPDGGQCAYCGRYTVIISSKTPLKDVDRKPLSEFKSHPEVGLVLLAKLGELAKPIGRSQVTLVYTGQDGVLHVNGLKPDGTLVELGTIFEDRFGRVQINPLGDRQGMFDTYRIGGEERDLNRDESNRHITISQIDGAADDIGTTFYRIGPSGEANYRESDARNTTTTAGVESVAKNPLIDRALNDMLSYYEFRADPKPPTQPPSPGNGCFRLSF